MYSTFIEDSATKLRFNSYIISIVVRKSQKGIVSINTYYRIRGLSHFLGRKCTVSSCFFLSLHLKNH